MFVNSGTDALRIALLSLKEKYKWQDGDQVAVPALTFVATINTILQAGLKPLLVDVGMNDHLINPYNLERKINTSHLPHLKAILPVHLFGQACDNYIYEIARKYKLKVLEDSCETVLNKTLGDVSCHSTYMAHHVTTGVGGMASTNDSELMLMMRSYANHGRNSCYIPGFTNPGLPSIHMLRQRFSFDRIGYSGRGTEFEAVLGLAQMPGLKKSVNDRRAVFIDLLDALGKFDELSFVGVTNNTCMMFPVVLKEKSKVDKYDFCLHLEKNGIETRDMMPITSQPCYRGMFDANTFVVAERVNKSGFYLGCHPGMGKKDVAHVQNVFEQYLTK